jgi:predicted protein tyrosine phosphatase
MLIEPLGQQIAVCSFEEAARLTNADKGFWNVVSIRGSFDPKADLRWAKTIHHARFDDVEDDCSIIYRSPRHADVADIFDYIRSLEAGPSPAPLLIHCALGISRSTAVALAWIYGNLPASDDRPVKAIDLLLELRPQAKPNRLVLTFGLAQCIAVDDAHELAQRLLADPRLEANRLQRRSGNWPSS